MLPTPSVASALEHEAMLRALDIASQGPSTGVNPQVGCVLINADGVIVSEGFHLGSGTPHAEVVALDSLRSAGSDPKGLTAVVTLEPCSHTGKTGPCCQALIEAGIERVLYCVSDPGPDSAGGAKVLSQAGVSVVSGVEQEAGEKLIERWLVSTRLQRPWVSLKWAMSLDGRSAATDGTSQWITGEKTRARVHLQRSDHDAIAVGTNTALVDNPSLTARQPNGTLYEHQPLAVVVGRRDIPGDALIRSHPGGFLQHHDHDLRELGSELFGRGIRSLYIEGGPTFASAFVAENLVDEFHITMGSMLLGGPTMALGDIGVSTMDEAKHLDIRSVEHSEGDVLVVARPRNREF